MLTNEKDYTLISLNKNMRLLLFLKKIELFQIVFGFLLILLVTSNSYAEDYLVRNDNNLLSVKAKGATVEQVFNEIATKFAVYVNVFPEMKNIEISADFEKVPLAEGVRKLVEGNYALVTRQGNIESIYVLSKGKEFQKRTKLMEKFIGREFFNLDELKEFVTRSVRKQHPKADLLALIPHEDIRGNLKSYAFCFYLGEGDTPTIQEIERQVKMAWEQKKAIRNDIKDGYKKSDNSKIIGWSEKSKEYDHMLRRNGDFITLEISANYDSPPIKSFYRGICYDIAMYPNAVDLLKDQIVKEKSYEFKRTFRFDALAIGFEFEDSNKKKYYVDVLNKSVFTAWKERSPARERTINKKTKERIKEQWLEILGS